MCNQVVFEPSDEEIRLIKILKALGNPTRLLILTMMADCSPCICGEIVSNLPLAQSTVSQHLKVLKDSGLILGIEEGSAICYFLNSDALNWFRRKLEQLSDDLLVQSVSRS